MKLRFVAQPEKEVPEVSLRRGRSAKKDTTSKTKERVQESKTRKRKAVDDISREGSAAKVASKRVSRTDSKANISKKVDNSGGGMPAKSSAPDVIVISDDEDKAQRKEPVDRKDEKMLQYRKIFFQSKKAPDISTPLKEEEPTPVPQISSRNLTPGCVVSDHASLIEELKKVRQELQVERDRVLSLRQEMEKREASTLLEREKYEARAKQELEAERQRSREKDKSYQDVQTKQTKLETEHTALQAQLEQERTARKQEQDHHAEVLQDILKSKTEDEHTREQVQILQNEKARLLAENETLKTMSSAVRKLPTLSPVPSSSSSTDEERRDENVRKMYIKVKRQYDILHSVANELAVCTRSMDLSSFGEFGSYLKKLRNSLDTDGRAPAEETQNSWKADEDTGSETKRSLA
jgi:DNA repair exonuclease SbcCD ATPase subunit